MQPEEGEFAPGDLVPLEPIAIEPSTVPVPQRQPFWNYVDLLLVAGLLVAFIAFILFVTAMFVFAFPSLRRNQAPLLLPTQIAVYVAVYVSLQIVLKVRYGKNVLSSLGWCPARLNLLLVGLSGVVLALTVAILTALIHTPKVPSPVESLMTSPLLLSLFGIMAVTLAPFFEELLFRGFLQPLLTRSLGVIAGVVLTAAFFGSLHAPEYSFAWQYAVAVSLVGVVLGWVRVRANSIIPCVVLHGAYNSFFVVGLVIAKFSPDK